jgi:hypothetical protein
MEPPKDAWNQRSLQRAQDIAHDENARAVTFGVR